ncbi:terpene synthase family protein [Streptomyces longisporus]|uniref:Terpene synthase n=1 Tax=Streptomyces longisporus TaxID=1948 RepID=A0ABN3NIE3_STRLO
MTSIESDGFCFYCPIEPAVHPEAAQVDEAARRWAKELGIGSGRRQETSDYGQMVCRWAPDGDRELLDLATRHAYVTFALDDLLFDSGPICRNPDQVSLLTGRLVRSLTSPEAEPPPSGFPQLDRAVAAQRACSAEIRAKCQPDTVRRWIDSMVEWYVGALSVVAHRQMGKVLGFRDYLNLGYMDRAIRYCVVVIQIAEGTALPNAELESPLVRAVTEAAYLLVTVDSDLYSYKKEALEGTLEMNVVSALMQEGHSAEYPVRRAFELRNMVMGLFMQLIRQAGAGASAELSRYLRQLEHLVRGNLDWGLRAPRYDVQGDAVPFRLVAAPRPNPLVPSTLPEIAWWWELIA